MGWNGSGTFNRLFSWTADAATGIDISSSRMDADTNDMTSDGFGNCVTRDGRGPASANQPMNGDRHTNVGNGVTANVPNGLTARTITKTGGVALQPGDIPGALADVVLRYNSANMHWELLNPTLPSAVNGNVDLTNQSSAIAATTFCNTPNDGVAHNYLISFWTWITATDAGGRTYQVNASITDEVVTRRQLTPANTSVGVATLAGGLSAYAGMVQALPNTNIQYGVTVTGSAARFALKARTAMTLLQRLTAALGAALWLACASAPAQAQGAICPITPSKTANNTLCANSAWMQNLYGQVLSGDLSGTLPNSKVAKITKINGTSVPASASANQALIATSSTAATGGAATNAVMAQMAPNSIKCNNIGSTAAPIDCTGLQAEGLLEFQAGCVGAVVRTLSAKLGEIPGISVNDCGADPSGVADSTTAFQNAINALPATGGLILCPAGTYKISSTLTMGNGTSSSVSTKFGILLTGPPGADQDIFGPYSTSPGCVINWSGASNTPIIEVKGPLTGWGIQYIQFLCNSVTGAIGLRVTSAQYGESAHLYFRDCFKGIISTTVAPFGGNETDSIHNNYTTISMNVPDVAGAIGITLTGDSGGSSDTDFNVFKNLSINMGAPTNATVGILLQICDSNNFQAVHIASSPGASQAIKFDYSVNAQFPAANFFFGADPGPTGDGGTRVAWAQSGTPNQTSRPNYVFGVAENNGGLQPKISANNFAPQVVNPGLDLTGQTGAIAVTNILPYGATVTGMYQVCYYYEVTTGDVGGANLTISLAWTDDAGAKTFSNGAIDVAAGAFQALCVPLRFAFNTQASVSTSLSAAVTTLVYQLHIRVVKLD